MSCKSWDIILKTHCSVNSVFRECYLELCRTLFFWLVCRPRPDSRSGDLQRSLVYCLGIFGSIYASLPGSVGSMEILIYTWQCCYIHALRFLHKNIVSYIQQIECVGSGGNMLYWSKDSEYGDFMPFQAKPEYISSWYKISWIPINCFYHLFIFIIYAS